MTLEELVSKYITSAEHVLSEVKRVESCVNVDANSVKNVLEFAKTYLDDAKYYKDKNRFEVSLASVAYCEGLLDALKLLGAVKFEWPVKGKESGK
jgi:FAD synthetase